MIELHTYEKIEGLDTLRFFSFFAVFLFHTTKGFEIGMYGVDFFFVLSSFLITNLTLREIQNTNGFSRFNFFIRRALRIFPIYFLVVLASFLLLPPLGKMMNQSISLPESKWLYFFFLSNYDPQDSIFALKFLWSIAVEEQFYLLFLILAPLFKKQILLVPLILGVLWAASLLLPLNLNLQSYTSAFHHLPNFTIGMLAGIAYFLEKKFRNYDLLIFICSLLICIFSGNPVVFSISISFFFAALIFIVINRYSYVQSVGFLKKTESLGRRSYGLYLYSGFSITFISKIIGLTHGYLNMLFAFIVLLLAAYVSYHYYERFFLKLKKRFR